MKMLHVTIQAADLEKSIKFYQDILGLHIGPDLREHGMEIVFLRNDMGETAIELIQNTDAPYQGTGIAVGFETDDLDTKRAELETAGYDPTPVIQPNPMTRFFFITDPNGLKIQFVAA